MTFFGLGIAIFFFIHGQVGGPACAGNLDLLPYFGINKVIFCGGGGVLDKNIEVGKSLVVNGAIRDEGFSYHYFEPFRVVYCEPKYAKKNDYLIGLTRTADAIFREIIDCINFRRSEGAKIVEVEQAGCISVALFFKGLLWRSNLWGRRCFSK